jgi:F-type H+-transporting ATPase subunit b
MLIAMLAETTAIGADDAKAVFPPFETWHMPSQLFWLALLFSALYFGLSRFILPKMGDTLERRSDRIASDLDKAARLNEEAVEAQQALELKLAQSRAKARETGDRARAKVDAEVATELAKVDSEIEAKLEAADARVAKMRSDAMKNVESLAVDAANAMMGRFGVEANEKDLKQAVQTALEP